MGQTFNTKNYLLYDVSELRSTAYWHYLPI